MYVTVIKLNKSTFFNLYFVRDLKKTKQKTFANNLFFSLKNNFIGNINLNRQF